MHQAPWRCWNSSGLNAWRLSNARRRACAAPISARPTSAKTRTRLDLDTGRQSRLAGLLSHAWRPPPGAGASRAPLQCPVPHETFTGLSLEDLAARLGSRTRALAARKWLYDARPAPARLPERIPGVSPEAWAALCVTAPLPAYRLTDRREASDGTTKLVLDLSGAAVETVLIPGRGRSTVCVSSQAGCTRHCQFCATA